jgi:hypothetical protein
MAGNAAQRKGLSGASNGVPVKVAASASPGTTIHTAVAGTVATTWDEIWLWCSNSDTVDHKLTLQWGGTTSPDDNMQQTIPAGQTALVAAGWILQNGLVVKAFADTANVLIITGHINAIS